MVRTTLHARQLQPEEGRGRPSWLARVFVVAWLVAMWPIGGSADEGNSAQQEVFAAESAFAKSMADRDFEAFGRYVADDTIFFGGKDVQRGKSEVLAAWSGFFEGEQAPFSWEPDGVEVLSSGELALSTGPVRNPEGKVVARFNSIWRREAPGTWRVVFDKGSPPERDDVH
jgi:ketosteroid isomerase-like protein